MIVETNWLQENYMKVQMEMRKSTNDLEEILNELGYSEEERQKLRWVFIN